MRIIALIDQPEVIEKILTHLELWPYAPHAPPSSAVAKLISDLLHGLF
jgi:hypothetical protein